MCAKQYDIVPKEVKPVATPYRRINSPLPAPGYVEELKKLRRYEPASMSGQPSIVWDRAEGFQVYDTSGNMWLDWSSGVVVANAGHGRKEIVRAIVETAQKSLLHTYLFPNKPRADLAEKLVEISPSNLDKVFLLTTGSEAVENTIKVSRQWGLKTRGKKKKIIVSFSGSFHGRTMGAQMVGGIPSLKEWIGFQDPSMIVAPFPNCFRCPAGRPCYEGCEEACFALFEDALRQSDACGEEVAAVITESYQGGEALFAPKAYVEMLSAWCEKNEALLIFDEVQASFGRTGAWFAFEHYGVTPNLVACGKGISSSLPLACVLGEARTMDLFEPGEMTSTHAANPVCAAATLANIKIIEDEGLVERARTMGKVMQRELGAIRENYSDYIGYLQGKGLVWAMHTVKKGTRQSDPELAFEIIRKAVEKGLMLTAPLGPNYGSIKMMPPLIITEEAIVDGAQALREAVDESISH